MRRRDLLFSGFAGLALAELLARDAVVNAGPGRIKAPHHPPRAKRVIQLFMAGAASHVDMFDHKPLLEEKHGQPWDPGETVELFQSSPGACLASPWKFRPYGESGKKLSDIVAPLGDVVDDIAFIHNVVGKTGVHSQGTLLQTTGFQLPGFPSAGSWLSYALGTLNENLPKFIVLPDHRGVPPNGPGNWSSGFLPAAHQATTVRVGTPNPIHDLRAPAGAAYITPESEREGLALLDQVNQQHLAGHPGDSRLEARIAS